MKAIWAWIVQAAQNVYKTGWEILGVFRDKNGKTSFKRISAAAAFAFGVDLLFRGGRIEGLILLGYAAVMGIIAGVTGS